MYTDDENRVIALAGILQAARLVKTIAHSGVYDHTAFQTSIETLLKIDAPSAVDIFGDPINLNVGLHEVVQFLDQSAKRDTDIVRYLLSLIHVERKIFKNKRATKRLEEGVARAIKQAEVFHPTHANVMANLAGLYTDLVTPLSFKINIIGRAFYLQQQVNMNKIRAMLLAGIRSAVLWRQLGGSRWHFLLKRNSTIKTAKSLLAKNAEALRQKEDIDII